MNYNNELIFEYEVTVNTGTTKTLISKTLADEKNLVYKRNKHYSIMDASGNHMKCEGICLTWIKSRGGESQMVEALISSSLSSDIFFQGPLRLLRLPELEKVSKRIPSRLRQIRGKYKRSNHFRTARHYDTSWRLHRIISFYPFLIWLIFSSV